MRSPLAEGWTMDSLRLVVVASLVTGVAASSLADDVLVPQDVRNLKDALLNAQPGDRVIVTGGTWRNGRVLSDIDLVGRSGATLAGLWEIQGAGATVQGFTVRDGSIEIETDRVTLRRNRFVGSQPAMDPIVTGTGVKDVVFENNRCTFAGIWIHDSAGFIGRGNRLSSSEIAIYGDDTTLEDNVLDRHAQIGAYNGANAVVRRNTRGSIFAWGVSNATVQENTVGRGSVVSVSGHGALVADNELVGSNGMSVQGDDAIVRANRVSGANVGVTVEGDRAVVTDNVVENRSTRVRRGGVYPLLRVRGAGPASILRNDLSHGGLAGLSVECDGSEIASNTIHGGGRSVSLAIVGDRNNVHDNTIRRSGGSFDTGTGINLVGTENVVADCSVQGAPYDGVSVDGAGNFLARLTVEDVGRCGITVVETSTSTGVADCTADGARWSALFVLGTDTTVTGGSFTNGRKVDVLDLGTNTQFVSSTFATKSENEGLRPYH